MHVYEKIRQGPVTDIRGRPRMFDSHGGGVFFHIKQENMKGKFLHLYFIHLSIFLCMYLSIYLYIYPYIHLPFRPRRGLSRRGPRRTLP